MGPEIALLVDFGRNGVGLPPVLGVMSSTCESNQQSRIEQIL